jgi:hypothetical protein
MTTTRKRWSGTGQDPSAPDLALSIYMQWKPDFARKYSTINGYEPNNLIAAAAWTKIPKDLIASDAVIYKDKKTGLWVQAVGYPLITRENYRNWIELQTSLGAVKTWTNQYAQPRLPLRPYTQQETPGKVIDQVSYIEMIAEQGKFMVNGIDLCELNPRGRPKDLDVYAEPPKRKTYPKRSDGKFYARSNSKFIETPKGIFISITAAADANDMTFSGLNYHLKKRTPGYRTITHEEYLIRSAILNKSEATE